MSDSVVGIGAEKVLQEAPWVINKIKRMFGGTVFVTLCAASTTVDNLISRMYGALEVSGTTNEIYGKELRALCRILEQYMNIGRKKGLFGATSGDQDTTIAALSTVGTADADTDLRYLFSKVITMNGYDATIEPDGNCTMNYAYATTG
jgi:hypothetical protein